MSQSLSPELTESGLMIGQDRLYSPVQRLINVYLFVIFLALLCGGFVAFSRGGGDPDFANLYAQAQLVYNNPGSEFYNLETQYRVQQQTFSGRYYKDGVLPYIHPPFAVLLVLPFGLLNFEKARVLWTLLNLCLICFLPWLIIRLNPRVFAASRTTLVLGALAFCPFLVTLWHGQTSLFLVITLIIFNSFLRKGKEVASGVSLGVGFIRFHMVYLFVAVLLLKGKWKALSSLALTLIILFGASWIWLGSSAMIQYGNLLRMMSTIKDTMGVSPEKLQNWKGLIYSVGFWQIHGTLGSIILVSVSGGLLFLLWRSSWNPSEPEFSLQFAGTIFLSLCGSPYLNIHDLSLAFFAAALCLEYLLKMETFDTYSKFLFVLLLVSPLVWLFSTAINQKVTLHWSMVWMTTMFAMCLLRVSLLRPKLQRRLA